MPNSQFTVYFIGHSPSPHNADMIEELEQGGRKARSAAASRIGGRDNRAGSRRRRADRERGRPITRRVLSSFEKCKAVLRTGVGFDWHRRTRRDGQRNRRGQRAGPVDAGGGESSHDAAAGCQQEAAGAGARRAREPLDAANLRARGTAAHGDGGNHRTGGASAARLRGASPLSRWS